MPDSLFGADKSAGESIFATGARKVKGEVRHPRVRARDSAGALRVSARSLSAQASGGGLVVAALMEQLELPLWNDLRAIEAAPETADLVALLDRLEASMESLPLQEKL